MTLRAELERLRGEAIGDRTPIAQVPFNETSDAEKLCRHPVVSVRMLAYQHEQFIAQAIEGVMMQQTDFEFELIVSDDCSADKTRQIAEEWQKKYPEKIRVLWWTENQYKIGGNSTRLWAACRGEFVAFCEGDDYWVDPLKLQRQVDAMRANPRVGLCFCGMQRFIQSTGETVRDPMFTSKWPAGLIDGKIFAKSSYVVPTQTALVRMSIYRQAEEKFEILNWCLTLGDLQLFKAMSLLGDVWCHHEVMATYRIHGASAMHVMRSKIDRDGGLVQLYFMRKTEVWQKSDENGPIAQIGRTRLQLAAENQDAAVRRRMIAELKQLKGDYPHLFDAVGGIGLLLAKAGKVNLLAQYIRVRRGIKRRLGLLK